MAPSLLSLRRVHTVAGDFALPSPEFPAGLRCLLLDTTSERDATAAQLRQCAYDVTSTGSASEALEALAAAAPKQPFDVLLLDGEAMYSSGKLRDYIKELPTVVIMESSKPEDVMQSIKLGVAEVLERPLCPLKLKNIWQHTVRRIMRSTSTVNQQQLLVQQRERSRACKTASAGRRSSQECATSQNGSSTAPELSFCPVTPLANSAGENNSASKVAQDTSSGQQAPDLAAAQRGSGKAAAGGPGSPMSCGTAPTFNHNHHNKDSSSNNAKVSCDLNTATSAMLQAVAPVNVHESALYAPPPSTPVPQTGGLLRAGSNSGTLTATVDTASRNRSSGGGGGAHAAARLLGVKRKSKDMSRATSATVGGGSSDSLAAAAEQLGLGGEEQDNGDGDDQFDQGGMQLPPARRCSASFDNHRAGGLDATHQQQQQQQQQTGSPAAAVVSGDDLLLVPFGSFVDELLGAPAGAAAAPIQQQQQHHHPQGAQAAQAQFAGATHSANSAGGWPAPSPAAAQHAIGAAVGLPPGMTWGMALNPAAVAPGITPPIFPAPAGPVMAHPLAPSLWPAAPGMPPPPTPGCPMPSPMFNPAAAAMMGFGGMPPPPPMFNPMAAACMPNPMAAAHMGGMFPGGPANPAGMMMGMHVGGGPGGAGAPSPQLPALPMSMLMGACGTGGGMGMTDPAAMHQMGTAAAASYGMGGAYHPGSCMPQQQNQQQQQQQMAAAMGMSARCSPTPTDPSVLNGGSLLSEPSGHEMHQHMQQQQQQMQQHHAGGGKAMMHHGGKMKMGRCESHHLLPSLLEDLMADGDMDLELETLSLTADLAAATAPVPVF